MIEDAHVKIKIHVQAQDGVQVTTEEATRLSEME